MYCKYVLFLLGWYYIEYQIGLNNEYLFFIVLDVERFKFKVFVDLVGDEGFFFVFEGVIYYYCVFLWQRSFGFFYFLYKDIYFGMKSLFFWFYLIWLFFKNFIFKFCYLQQECNKLLIFLVGNFVYNIVEILVEIYLGLNKIICLKENFFYFKQL